MDILSFYNSLDGVDDDNETLDTYLYVSIKDGNFKVNSTSNFIVNSSNCNINISSEKQKKVIQIIDLIFILKIKLYFNYFFIFIFIIISTNFVKNEIFHIGNSKSNNWKHQLIMELKKYTISLFISIK
jgi:hypothetical protein